jgi:hypothetical protein
MVEVEVGFVVEGHGDTKAVPEVFRRICAVEFPGVLVRLRQIIRVSRDKLKRPGELERTIELLARWLGGNRAILVTIDTEGEPPGCLGPELLQRALSQGCVDIHERGCDGTGDHSGAAPAAIELLRRQPVRRLELDADEGL